MAQVIISRAGGEREDRGSLEGGAEVIGMEWARSFLGMVHLGLMVWIWSYLGVEYRLGT